MAIKIMGVQILGFIFGASMLYLSYIYFRRKEFKRNDFLFWFGVWLVFLLVIFSHQKMSFILKPLSIVRTLDLFMILGFLFFSALIFILYKDIKKANQRLEKIVREVAIKRVKR